MKTGTRGRSRVESLTLAVVLMGTMALMNGTAGLAQAQAVKFTELKFFSTKGEFDWDKVVYGTEFDQARLHELQVLVEFENPDAKPFDLEVKGYRDGKLFKTEPYKDLKESGGFNSGMGGDAGAPGTVEPGVYKAEVWYGGKVVKTAEATVIGGAVREEPEGEWQAPQPEKWASLKDVNFSMGFAKEWIVTETPDVVLANAPDKKVLIIAELVEAKTPQEARDHLQEELDRYLAGITLTDPEVRREENGLKVLATGGAATQKGAGAVDVGVDIIEVEGKIVVVAIYGAAADMNEYTGDIIIAQQSYKNAR